MAIEQRFVSRGFPAPQRPEYWATEGRCAATPTAYELRAMMECACSVDGGVAVLLMDHTQPWPYRGPG